MFVSAVRSDSLCSVFVLSDGTVFRFGRRLLFFVLECSITLSNKRNLDSDGVSKVSFWRIRFCQNNDMKWKVLCVICDLTAANIRCGLSVVL